MSGKYRKEHNCLNCGFEVEEHYCSRCGQPNLELKENFWAFISHSIAHYFHFDNKFFQTLVPLLSKPGRVTLDYLAGKRARYINPISMYIFVSIVYFLVVPPPKKKATKEKTYDTVAAAEQKAALDTARQKLAKYGLDTTAFAQRAKEEILEEIDRSTFRKLGFQEQKRYIDDLKKANQANSNDVRKLIARFEEIHGERNDSTYVAYMARQQRLPESERDNLIERWFKKRDIGFGEKSVILNEQMERNKSKQYFLFMPLMALFIMINFRKNHIRYLDHLVFTIHGMTAFFIVSIFTQPTKRLLFHEGSIMSGIIETALIGWICWYLFKSLKVFYQRKTSTTIWRMIWVIFLYGVTIEISESVMREILFYFAT